MEGEKREAVLPRLADPTKPDDGIAGTTSLEAPDERADEGNHETRQLAGSEAGTAVRSAIGPE
jgi:hypothetical protein